MIHELRRHGFDVEWHRAEQESDYLARLSPELDVIDDRTIGVLDVESPNVDAVPKGTREFSETFAVLAALAILAPNGTRISASSRSPMA
jgi:hypothetical protein